MCPLRFLGLAGNLQGRRILSCSLQGVRARGPPPLPTPGCLQTKLPSHSSAHPSYCLDLRLLFPERCPRHGLPDSEVVRTRRVLDGHPVNSPPEVGPSSLSSAPEILSCMLLCFTCVFFPLKMGAPYRPRAHVPLCAPQCIRAQAGVRGSPGTGLGGEAS